MKKLLQILLNGPLRGLKRRIEYRRAYRRWLAKPPFHLSGPPEKYQTREEIYDRHRR